MIKKEMIGTILNTIAILQINLMIILLNSEWFDLYRYIAANGVLDKIYAILLILFLIGSPMLLLISLTQKIIKEKYRFSYLRYILVNIVLVFTVSLSFIIKFETFSVKLFKIPIFYSAIYLIFASIIILKFRKVNVDRNNRI
jgi:hypothetical protein